MHVKGKRWLPREGVSVTNLAAEDGGVAPRTSARVLRLQHSVADCCMADARAHDTAAARKAIRVVFVALLIDLLAFTMPCVPSAQSPSRSLGEV